MMRNVLLTLLAIGILAVLSIAGVFTASALDDGNHNTDIAAIAASPNEWSGKEVMVEGMVVRTFSTWFVLYGGESPSIMVKTTDIMPSEYQIVRVNGTVRVQSMYGDEQTYIFAQSWQ